MALTTPHQAKGRVEASYNKLSSGLEGTQVTQALLQTSGRRASYRKEQRVQSCVLAFMGYVTLQNFSPFQGVWNHVKRVYYFQIKYILILIENVFY